MEHVRALSEKYKFVAMDTEFPGVIARPVGSFGSVAEYNYQVRPQPRCRSAARRRPPPIDGPPFPRVAPRARRSPVAVPRRVSVHKMQRLAKQ